MLSVTGIPTAALAVKYTYFMSTPWFAKVLSGIVSSQSGITLSGFGSDLVAENSAAGFAKFSPPPPHPPPSPPPRPHPPPPRDTRNSLQKYLQGHFSECIS